LKAVDERRARIVELRFFGGLDVKETAQIVGLSADTVMRDWKLASYVNAAIHDALKEGVMVYSIFLRGAGFYGTGAWVTNLAQSRLIEVSEETGGHAYYQGFTDPVSVLPFLKDFQNRLENQYEVTIEGLIDKGVQPVKLHSDLRGPKIEGPTHVYVR
jgi:ECF sigma factor